VWRKAGVVQSVPCNGAQSTRPVPAVIDRLTSVAAAKLKRIRQIGLHQRFSPSPRARVERWCFFTNQVL
jgi:hypothetical protein